MSSNSASKLTRTETNADGVGHIDDIASGSAPAASDLATSEDVVFTFIDVFTADILPEILDNLGILTAKDLLNFRLVNRCWRDAATSVLLKRNLCEITIDFGKVELIGDNAVWHSAFLPGDSLVSGKYFKKHHPRLFLSDLSQLISTSSKFPSASICFYFGCSLSFENLCPKSDDSIENQHKKDLFHFFSVFGKKIKKLSLQCRISKKAVRNLLYVHMPHLISLDIQQLFELSIEDQAENGNAMQVCLPPPSILEIKEICLGHQDSGPTLIFVEELISASPNLKAFKNVDVSSLGVLLKMEKSHLIQDLQFNPKFREMSTIQRLANLLKENILAHNVQALKLSKLSVMFHNIPPFKSMFGVVENVVNIILSASNSLKCLEISITQSDEFSFNVLIPPLPQLEHLSLSNYNRTITSRFHFVGDAIGRGIKTGENMADGSDQQGTSNILVDYFPLLRKVSLSTAETINNSDKLLGFFSLEHSGSNSLTTIPGDTLLTVTDLDFSTYVHFQSYSKISKLFPNVSHLKMYCYFSCCLQNWVWTAFPKLKRFEIVTSTRYWDTKLVDSFFTGISPELCAAFEMESTPSELSGPAKVRFRTQPYIGDCENLKEFKIKFERGIETKFASETTAVLGLQDVVHRTKIIFEFGKLSGRAIEAMHQNLDPIAAHVEIRLK